MSKLFLIKKKKTIEARVYEIITLNLINFSWVKLNIYKANSFYTVSFKKSNEMKVHITSLNLVYDGTVCYIHLSYFHILPLTIFNKLKYLNYNWSDEYNSFDDLSSFNSINIFRWFQLMYLSGFN